MQTLYKYIYLSEQYGGWIYVDDVGKETIHVLLDEVVKMSHCWDLNPEPTQKKK